MPRNNLLSIIILLLAAHTISAQEVVTALQYGPQGTAKHAKSPIALSLPFFDDFSNYQGSPSIDRWISYGAWVNTQFALLPPTIGMMTLDAINEQGNLYYTGSSSMPFPADTVLSMPLRLDSLLMPVARRLSPADSLALSFYYLPGGGSGDMWTRTGDSPNRGDSLILEFYDAASNRWDKVWGTDGISVDSLVLRTGTTWQYVYVPITLDKYLTSDFRFRFRNYCSFDNTIEPGLVGNSDQWHIDYVLLDYGRNYRYTFARDVAFVEPAPSMLRRYQAMPASQYRTDEMASSIAITITNRYEETLSTRYQYAEADEWLTPYDGGIDNITPFAPSATYQTAAAHAAPPVSGAFPADGVQRTYHIIHTVTEGVGGDPFPQNDTIHFYQHIENYYAYDDGTAENGYGIYNMSGAVEMAYRIDLNQADTLTAVALYFNRTRSDENASMAFQLCVWDDNDGQPGQLIYCDNATRYPRFTTINRYITYRLEKPLPIDGPIYVGLQQTTPGIINLGMDRNNNASEHTFYKVGGGWQQSFIYGALMIRPYLGTLRGPNMGAIADVDSIAAIRLFPNPASNTLHVETPHPAALSLYSIQGQLVAHTVGNTLSVAALADGIYSLSIALADGQHLWRKVIIKH